MKRVRFQSETKKIKLPSRPPVNLTRMRSLTYFERSSIASLLGLSAPGGPPAGITCERFADPRAPPRAKPPRPWIFS
jgi:hypothetical protein